MIFFLVLCRIRCGLMETDLSFRFQTSQSTVYIKNHYHLDQFPFKDLTLWPSKEQVNYFMPQLFKEFYPTTRWIIDATELFIQSPCNPQAQQLAVSSYKNHNTLKALDYMYNTIWSHFTFISKLRGGSISDWELFEKSGFLELLEPGDSITADRGFTIADILDTKESASTSLPWRLVISCQALN